MNSRQRQQFYCLHAQAVEWLAPRIAGKLVVAKQDEFMNNISLFMREVLNYCLFEKYSTLSTLIIANSHCIEEIRTRGECKKTKNAMPCGMPTNPNALQNAFMV